MAAVQILAAESCRQKRLRVVGDSEKKTPWWNQRVKKQFEQTKKRSRACYKTDCHLNCISDTRRREKRQLWQ